MQTLPPGSFAVAVDKPGGTPGSTTFTYYESAEHFFMETADKEERNYYEIILKNQPCTMYFDINHYTQSQFKKDGTIEDDKLDSIVETICQKAKE